MKHFIIGSVSGAFAASLAWKIRDKRKQERDLKAVNSVLRNASGDWSGFFHQDLPWGNGDKIVVPQEFEAEAHAHPHGEECNESCGTVSMNYHVEGNYMTITKKE